MSSILESVDQRTKLVGENRMELLLFQLDGDQLYGINVFKVREVSPCPSLTLLPKSHRVVRGIADFRGKPIPVIDLAHAIGGEPLENIEEHFVIITEYNLNVQALLVNQVERIVNRNWDDIKPPPVGATSASGSYLTAVTNINDRLVEIIDVEKVLDEVSPGATEVDENELRDEILHVDCQKEVLVIDDSNVARTQLKKTLESLGMEVMVAHNGQEGLGILKNFVNQGVDPNQKFLMVISDIEMPEMDGYTFTSSVRGDPKLKDLFVVLHTSLSGGFNKTLVEKVGANEFMAKYQPNSIATVVKNRLRTLTGNIDTRI